MKLSKLTNPHTSQFNQFVGLLREAYQSGSIVLTKANEHEHVTLFDAEGDFLWHGRLGRVLSESIAIMLDIDETLGYTAHPKNVAGIEPGFIPRPNLKEFFEGLSRIPAITYIGLASVGAGPVAVSWLLQNVGKYLSSGDVNLGSAHARLSEANIDKVILLDDRTPSQSARDRGGTKTAVATDAKAKFLSGAREQTEREIEVVPLSIKSFQPRVVSQASARTAATSRHGVARMSIQPLTPELYEEMMKDEELMYKLREITKLVRSESRPNTRNIEED